MTLDAAIKNNPYDSQRGDMSAYARYIRYNVDGMYYKTNDEVKRILQNKGVKANERKKRKEPQAGEVSAQIT